MSGTAGLPGMCLSCVGFVYVSCTGYVYISYKVHLCFVSRIIIFCVQGLFIHCVHGLFHVLFTGFVCVVRSHGIQASGSIPRANISTRTTGELVFLCVP